MVVKATQRCVAPLVSLGFTELEATVYAFLVQESPATGYRVAQGIGKPIANTYKTIESLQSKGAVMADETGNKLCRAVPPDEVLQQLEVGFSRHHRRASNALARLRPATGDNGVYSLVSTDLVYERFRAMLGRAKEIAVVDLFPAPLERVKNYIEACAARGVTVAAQVYEPATLAGVETVRNIHPAVARQWPGDWLNVVVDGREMLLAYMEAEGDGVLQGIWSKSPYLCWAYQSGIAGEMLAARLQEAIDENESTVELRSIIERFGRFRAHESLGYSDLGDQFDRDE